MFYYFTQKPNSEKMQEIDAVLKNHHFSKIETLGNSSMYSRYGVGTVQFQLEDRYDGTSAPRMEVNFKRSGFDKAGLVGKIHAVAPFYSYSQPIIDSSVKKPPLIPDLPVYSG